MPSTKEEGGSNSKSKSLKCFNCNQSRHIAVNCQQSKREKGACFKCLQIGHKAKDCSVSGTAVKENVQPKASVNSVFKENDEFLRKIRYEFCNEEEQCEVECNLDTLLDTRSPVSFVKENFVPKHLVKSSLVTNNRYGGLNGSILENKGRMIAKLSLNNTGFKIISLLVVPANTMKALVVIGRDVLKLFFNSTETTGEEYENQIIQEILNIDIADSAPKTGSELDVNHELPTDIQSTVKDLYEYTASQM